MNCQLECLILEEGVVITPPSVARRKCDPLCLGSVSQCGGGHFCFHLPAAGCRTNQVFATRNRQCRAGMVISAPTNPSLAAGRTSCSKQEIVNWTDMSSLMRPYLSLNVQTGRIITVTKYVGSSAWVSRFNIIVITISHLLAFRRLITAIIASGLGPLSAIFMGVSPTATGSGVLMIIAAAAAL